MKGVALGWLHSVSMTKTQLWPSGNLRFLGVRLEMSHSDLLPTGPGHQLSRYDLGGDSRWPMGVAWRPDAGSWTLGKADTQSSWVTRGGVVTVRGFLRLPTTLSPEPE